MVANSEYTSTLERIGAVCTRDIPEVLMQISRKWLCNFIKSRPRILHYFPGLSVEWSVVLLGGGMVGLRVLNGLTSIDELRFGIFGGETV